jgi:hypothetical protein
LNSTENNINNNKLRSRRSTSGLNCSESLTSFKSISNTVNNSTNSSDLNMIATHQQQTLTRNKSMVKLTNEETKQNNDSSKVNNKKTANLSSAVSTASSSSSSTSTSSSWLAQSFRKAFGSNKTENQTIKKKMNKNKIPKMMSSSLSINNYSTNNNNCNSTTIDENRSDRNSCNTTSSKRSSLSDDENESEHKSGRSLIQNNNSNNKLSLLPNHFNDTDSEYEEDFKKSTIKHKNVSLISKRSYRSESELVTKFQIQQQIQQQKQLQTKTNDESTYDTFNSKKLSTLNEINNPINIKVNNTPIRNVTKLSKTHKSVNSLLINSNTNENQFYKLQEINQSFYNQTDSPQTMAKVMSMQKFNKW